jgi:hypothetical protein
LEAVAGVMAGRNGVAVVIGISEGYYTAVLSRRTCRVRVRYKVYIFKCDVAV